MFETIVLVGVSGWMLQQVSQDQLGRRVPEEQHTAILLESGRDPAPEPGVIIDSSR